MNRIVFALVVVVTSASLAAYGEGFDLTPEEYARAEVAEAEARAEVQRPLTVEVCRPTHAIITGHGGDVAVFIDRYQSALWPDWRDDARYAAEVRESMARARKAGRALLWTGCEKSRAALATAVVEFPGDSVTLKTPGQ